MGIQALIGTVTLIREKIVGKKIQLARRALELACRTHAQARRAVWRDDLYRRAGGSRPPR